tara:strand:+ start:12097 stop:12339 length:243 start_codon:yes stop_codon:yes gene_type:complete
MTVIKMDLIVCRDCVFWDSQAVPREISNFGLCRRHAPQPYNDVKAKTGSWHKTWYFDGCGDGKSVLNKDTKLPHDPRKEL